MLSISHLTTTSGGPQHKHIATNVTKTGAIGHEV